MAHQRTQTDRSERDEAVIRRRGARRAEMAGPRPAYLQYFPDGATYYAIWVCLALVMIVALRFDGFWPIAACGSFTLYGASGDL